MFLVLCSMEGRVGGVEVGLHRNKISSLIPHPHLHGRGGEECILHIHGAIKVCRTQAENSIKSRIETGYK